MIEKTLITLEFLGGFAAFFFFVSAPIILYQTEPENDSIPATEPIILFTANFEEGQRN